PSCSFDILDSSPPRRSSVLLLDEPTTLLDDAAVAFLAPRLRQWGGPVLFASHDRAFLNEVATGLVDIDPAASEGVTRYGGGYSEDWKSTRLNSSHVKTSYAV